jgi:geranylgeranyl diphosphate synthase, type I
MKSTSDSTLSNEEFALIELGKYQKQINEILQKEFSSVPRNDYPETYPIHEALDNAFLDVLHRGGKRLRGALVLVAYDLFNTEEAVNQDVYTLAIATEIYNAYLLVLDDVDDQSEFRRGKPSAHTLLTNFKKKYNSKRSAVKFGNMMAVYSAIGAEHSMKNMIIETSFESKMILKILKSFNDTLHKAEFGQLLEAYLELTSQASSEDVLKVHEYKTGYYTIYQPLEIGAISAGATDHQINSLKEYALAVGIAFQLKDDILGLFGDTKITGKPAIDDLKEGKMTLLMSFALENASAKQKEVLLTYLGNKTISESELLIVQKIVEETGSFKHSEDLIVELIDKAKKSLIIDFPEYVDNLSIKFLIGIADYIANRKK